MRKRLCYVSTEQGLENRGNALARRRAKEPAQWTRFDELWQHADGERRLRRRARLFPSRPTTHAAVFRALRLAPASPDSYTYYARYLLSHSRADEARAFLRSALELSPTDLTARDLLAQANGQTQSRLAAQTPESYLTLSLQLYRDERYAESIVACRAALALRPNYAEAWNNIGAAYNKLGRYDEAAAACEQALLYKPDFELARNNLQYAREKLNASAK